jgi:putative ABC transport system permease protein
VAGGFVCLGTGWGLAKLPALGGLPVAALAGALALLASLLVTSGVAVDALARLESFPAVRRLGTPLRVAAAALAAGRRRAAWAAGAVGVAVALAVAIATMVHSFRTTVVDWTEEGMRSDIWVRPAAGVSGFQVGRLDPEIVRIAVRLFGADAVDPFHTAAGSVDGTPVTVGGGAMTVVARRGGVPFMGGKDSRDVFAETARTHGAVINESLARRLGIRTGDTIRVQTPAGETDRTVTGVFYDYSHSQGMVVLNLPDFLSLYPNDGPRQLAIFLPPGANAAAARDRFLHALGGRWLVDAFLNRELRHEVVAIFDRTFAITTALQLVASAVAVIAVLTVLFALLSERQRDLALLRALGGSRGQVARVVLAQAGLLGLTGALGGLVVGLGVGVVLVEVVNVQSFGWTLRLLPPWGALAATGAWVVAACLLAGVAPALSAMRMTPREGLREEG